MINNDAFKQPWQVTAKQTLVNVFNVVWENWPKAQKWGYICSRVTKYSCLSWLFFPWEKSTGYLNMYFYNTPKMIKIILQSITSENQPNAAHHKFLHVFMWTKQLTEMLRDDSSLFHTFNLAIHTSLLWIMQNSQGLHTAPIYLFASFIKQVDNHFSRSLAFTTNSVLHFSHLQRDYMRTCWTDHLH